jgi:hypothetical protein
MNHGDGQGNQLLGRDVLDRGHVIHVLRQHINDFHDDLHLGWSDEKVDEAQLLEYGRADVGGKEAIFATTYAKASMRVSFSVVARYEECVRGAPPTKEYVCKLQLYNKATARGRSPVRLVNVDLHALGKRAAQFGLLWSVKDFTKPSGTSLRRIWYASEAQFVEASNFATRASKHSFF